jgi:hypothetical protein
VPADVDVETSPLLIAANASDAIPSYDPNQPMIAIEIVPDAAATAPCDQIGGVKLAVTGHSEAVPRYMSTQWPIDRNVASTTGSVGPRAFIGGVTGASKVQVTGTKAGCQVKLVTASQTGNFLLLAGALSVGRATITN